MSIFLMKLTNTIIKEKYLKSEIVLYLNYLMNHIFLLLLQTTVIKIQISICMPPTIMLVSWLAQLARSPGRRGLMGFPLSPARLVEHSGSQGNCNQ